ncbi:hypothetical protein [Enterovirga rhinocerotis]|uniref:hypothetical protein n=1 Tax=Enterovirga rhinocerotis TaxID=1339210 RepID=UPI0010621658|nr:hypothetical protein [Enterovirga rhinocerotis]
MRTMVPRAFDLTFSSEDGPYRIGFEPVGEWDGLIEASIGGVAMRWSVDSAEQEDGAVLLGGMTSGSWQLWGRVFWFELRLDDRPAIIRYWDDRFVWREDRQLDGEFGSPETGTKC